MAMDKPMDKPVAPNISRVYPHDLVLLVLRMLPGTADGYSVPNQQMFTLKSSNWIALLM